jgi:hypothetical protein
MTPAQVEAVIAKMRESETRCRDASKMEAAGGFERVAYIHHGEADGIEWAARILTEALAESEVAPHTDDRRALVQGNYWLPRGTVGREPGTVAWSEHLEAWAQHNRDGHGSQSAERINERGGYVYNKITELLGHAPTTWRAGR